MKLLAALVLLLVHPVQAQVIVSKGSGVLASPALQAMCRQMHSNHLEDLDSLERTYQELANTTDADKISDIVRQIKEISSRIRFLAKPEWNSENIPIEITWVVPHLLFFDNSDYLDLKQDVRDWGNEWRAHAGLMQAVRDASGDAGFGWGPFGDAGFGRGPFGDTGFGRPPDLGRYLMGKPEYISEKALIKAEYLNSENQDITKFLSLKPDDYRGEYLEDRSFLVVLKKNVTALEACQFLKTIMFEVKISYIQTAFGSTYESEKNIYLIYRNEEASAK